MTELEPSITSAKRYIEFLLSRYTVIDLPAIPRCCFICYVADVIDLLKSRHPHRSLSLGVTNPMHVHFFTPEQGAPFAVARGLHGAPMAAIQLEELAALGCEEFLVVGPAGHPTAGDGPELDLGDLLLATRAWIYEGTSLHYGSKDQAAPGARAAAKLNAVLEQARQPFRQGAVATTDALYRETGAFLREILARRVLAIDMEISALYTVAGYLGKEIAALVFISDIVAASGSWEIAPSPKMYRKTVRLLADIARNFAEQP